MNMQSEVSASIESEYLIGKELGRGGFGVIRLCTDKRNGQQMACKTILKDNKGKEQNEVQIMQKLSDHMNVVKLHKVYEDKCFLHIVMEFCSGGTLLDAMKRELPQNGCYKEYEAAKIMKALTIAIKNCHAIEVVHRDIKPENILLTCDGQLRLADFGLSLHCPKGEKLSGGVGSLFYVAPEMLLGTYTTKVDVWAAGVILHVLLSGMLPFDGSNEDILQGIQRYEQLDFCAAEWRSVSWSAKDLLSKMLCKDVEKRLSASEVLRHQWIKFYTDYVKMPRKQKDHIHIDFSKIPKKEKKQKSPLHISKSG
uniref:TSA: Wollemia nobilis Ref_Wollemi_Transcript_8240_1567 transcribed RNA sequence n=1 Tax=Wollemia nobilis TaxID=56998 RepID=A0A0C9S9B9_9CONI